MEEILLNNKRSKRSVNVENVLSVEINATERLLPPNNVVDKVNSFTVYENECNASTKYRLIFGVNSICTNVLFNALTEVVKDEGSALVSRLNNLNTTDFNKPFLAVNTTSPLHQYDAIRNTEYSNEACGLVYHCGYDIFNNHLLRSKTFKSINIIGSQGSRPSDEKKVYNTIRDYTRLDNGRLVEEYPMHRVDINNNKRPIHLYQYDDILNFYDSVVNNISEENGWFGFSNITKIPTLSSSDETKAINKVMNKNKSCEIIDMYPDRSLYSFDPIFNSFQKRLEYNWLYFLTYPFSSTTNDLIEFSCSGKTLTGIKSDKYVQHTNVNSAGVVVFTCKQKHGFKHRDKIRLYYGVDWLSSLSKIDVLLTVEGVGDLEGNNKEHSFYVNAVELENFKIIPKIVGYFNNEAELQNVYTTNLLEDEYYEVGNNSVKNYYHYVGGNWVKLDDRQVEDNIFKYKSFAFRHYIDGFESDYYYRIFRKMPNFKFSPEEPTQDNIIDDSFLEKNTIPFNNTINRTAFAENIYGDEHVEIVFTDDIDVNVLRDNLGRPIHEIYLTILKNNRGYEKWYGFESLDELRKKFPNGNGDKVYVITDEDGNGRYYEWINNNWNIATGTQKNTEISDNNGDIEYSHAFGKLTSGLNLPKEEIPNDGDTINNYNMRYLHNITNNTDGYFVFSRASTPLEGEITINGGVEKDCFMGDLVEYVPSQIKEVVLEEVFHRFNTAQRETNNSLFSDLWCDELISDDYEIPTSSAGEAGFNVEHKKWNQIETSEGIKIYSANKYPEGYYYKPHYRIQIKDFDDNINYDTKSKIMIDGNVSLTSDLKWTFKTKMNYYLDIGEYIYVIQMENGKDIVEERCKIISIENRRVVIEKPNNILINSNFIFRKENYSIPFYAQNLGDGSGRYLWREYKTLSQFVLDNNLVFTNGAIYIEKGINFYLRRQDPFGEYGINGDNVSGAKFSEHGNKIDASDFEYQAEKENDIC